MSNLQAGTAAIDITPPPGTWMGGYGSRDHGAEGIHDPLMAKALALSDGRETLLLITCDTLSFVYEFVDPLLKKIEARSGVPADHIMVSNSHTHSGPSTRGARADEEYMATLAGKLHSVAEMALEGMCPVSLSLGTANVRVGHNRREETRTGVTIGHNPGGPLAPFVDVMALRTEENDLLAAWFCHAAHAVVLGGDNYLISADYPGEAQRAVEAVHPGATALFAQGCCGDINADRHPGSFDHVRSCGLKLSGGVLIALEDARQVPPTVLSAAKSRLELPLREPPPIEEIEGELDSLREELEAAEEEDLPSLEGRVRATERLLEDARSLTPKRFDITAFRIGPAAILGLPGEMFVHYALNIAELSPFSPTIVPAYTNGMVGYVPTADAFPKGGYEVDSSWGYYGGLGLAPDSEQIILEGARELLASLNR